MSDQESPYGLFVGNLPGRKSKALYEVEPGPDGRGAVLRPLAYFISDEALQWYLDHSPFYKQRVRAPTTDRP